MESTTSNRVMESTENTTSSEFESRRSKQPEAYAVAEKTFDAKNHSESDGKESDG